jgi:hypothetical protein
VLNPGVLMERKIFCYPGLNISGYIPQNSIIKSLNVS